MSVKFRFTTFFKYGFAYMTYRFFLFFHPTGHLWDCPVDCRILLQVRQFFCKVYWHCLRRIQGSSPERKFCRHRVFSFLLFVDTKNSKLFLCYIFCIFRPLNGPAETENSCLGALNHFIHSFTAPLSHN